MVDVVACEVAGGYISAKATIATTATTAVAKSALVLEPSPADILRFACGQITDSFVNEESSTSVCGMPNQSSRIDAYVCLKSTLKFRFPFASRLERLG